MCKRQERIYNDEIIKNLSKKNNFEIYQNYIINRYLQANKDYRQIYEGNIYPFKIDIEPTTRCMLNCRYCQVPYWERNKIPDLSFDCFKEMIDKLPYILELKLQGQGEPLLNKDFFKMVKYASDKGILVRTYTNGMCFNDLQIKECIDSGLFEIRFSLDGACEETLNVMRSGANLDIIKNNINNLVKARGGKLFPLINIWVIVTNKNINEVNDIILMCKELGVDGIKFQSKLSVKDEQLKDKVLHDTVNINEIKKVFDKAKILADEAGLQFELLTGKWRSNENPCWWIYNSATITSTGDVLPCCILNDPNQINFGNILNNNFEDIWGSNSYINFRKSIINMDIPQYCKWCYMIQ